MSFQLVLQSEAVIDIQQAFEWYEAQKPGLGYEFITEVEEGFEKICDHPLHYAAINVRFRRLKISRFPYLIVYEIENITVLVVAIKHTSKKSTF
jgi:plasmid stabilization system protein ParE